MATFAPHADQPPPQSDIVLMLDAQGVCHEYLTHFPKETATRAPTDVVGVPSRDQAVGQPLARLLPTPLALQIRASLAAVQETPLTLEYVGIVGYHRPAQRRYQIRLSGCGPDRFLCVIRDVTADADASPQSRQMHSQRYSALFTGSSFCIVLTDAQGTIIEANQAFAEMLAYDPDELVGVAITDLIVSEDRALDQQRLVERVANPACLHTNRWVEKRCLNRSGEIVWVRITVSIQRNAQGVAQLLTFLAEDISAAKATAKELQVRNRILEVVPHGVVLTDARQPHHPVLYVNTGFERLTGYTATEMLGKSCKILQGPDTDPATIAQIRTAITQRKPVLVELLNYRKDGTAFWNALSLMPVEDEHGQLAYFVGIQTDVTALKRFEFQFRQSQKMEAIGRLAGGVAHDFNNILTVITNYSELVITLLPPDSSLRSKIEQIQAAGQRATHLTQQLLTFSRHQHSRPVVLDLNELLTGLETILKRLVGTEIQLQNKLSVELALIEADPGQIEQIVTNLAVNARDAMPRGGQLVIQTEYRFLSANMLPSEPDLLTGHYICLSVRDTGHGMDEETQSHMFEPFFTTKDVGQGSGLGLSTVYGLVKQHQGFIVVDSQLARGTTVHLYFPQRSNAVATPLASTTLLSTPTAQSTRDANATVLVVEDEEPLRELMVMVLEEHGYEVKQATNEMAALQVAAAGETSIDLLLSDMLMAHMSGYDLYEKLTAMQPQLKAVFISGYTERQVTAQGETTAKLTFLSKPFTWQQLLQKVQTVLAN